jgi:hypothetical protein
MAVKNATIILKHGSLGNLSAATFENFEPLVAMDEGALRFYIVDEAGDPVWINPDVVEAAKKFSTSKTINYTGEVTGTVSTDFSASPINIALALRNSGVTPGTYTMVTVDAKGIVTAGANYNFDGDKVLLSLSTGEIVESIVTKAELARLAGIEDNVQKQIDEIIQSLETLDTYVAKVDLPYAISDITITQNAAGISIAHNRVNTDTGAVVPGSVNLQIASATITGLMPASAYEALETVIADVEVLKGATKRYIIDLTSGAVDPKNPTQQELDDEFERVSGQAAPAPDGTALFDPHLSQLYQYFETEGEWIFMSTPEIGLATQSAAGLVMGSMTNGQIFVESNGQMSLNGYSTLVPNTITVAGKPLSSNVVLESLTLMDGSKTVGTYNPSAPSSIDVGEVMDDKLTEYAQDVATALATKQDKQMSAVNNNIAKFNAAGQTIDSGKNIDSAIYEFDIIDGGTFDPAP